MQAARRTAGTVRRPFDSFASQKELVELAAGWPAERLVAIRNSLPGVTPVKKFKDRTTAATRIWRSIQERRALGRLCATFGLTCGFRLHGFCRLRLYRLAQVLVPIRNECSSFHLCWAGKEGATAGFEVSRDGRHEEGI
jgi:hypothetical protein